MEFEFKRSILLSVYLSTHQTICLFIKPSLHQSLPQTVCLSIYLSIYSTCLSVCLLFRVQSIYPSICLPVCLSVCFLFRVDAYLQYQEFVLHGYQRPAGHGTRSNLQSVAVGTPGGGQNHHAKQHERPGRQNGSGSSLRCRAAKECAFDPT